MRDRVLFASWNRALSAAARWWCRAPSSARLHCGMRWLRSGEAWFLDTTATGHRVESESDCRLAVSSVADKSARSYLVGRSTSHGGVHMGVGTSSLLGTAQEMVDNDGEVAGACTPLTPRVATAAGAAASFGRR